MAEGFMCAVAEEYYRSACAGGQYRDTGYCVLHYPGEEKNKDEFLKVIKSKLERQAYDFRGTVFPDGTSDFQRREFDADTYFYGATFIGRANFSEAQFSGENTDFVRAQFSGENAAFARAQFSGENTDFARAQFGGEFTDFSEARFSGEDAYFGGAQFSSQVTSFREAQFAGETTSFFDARFAGGATDFREVQFGSRVTSFTDAQFGSRVTSFTDAQFSGENAAFVRAQFSGENTDFARAQFSGENTDFARAQFSSAETSFQGATFMKEVVFSGATFKERAFFWGSKANSVFGSGAWSRFDRCRIEKPEQFSFNTVLLHPGWFCHMDVRKVDFTDVQWYGMLDGPEGTLVEEIAALKKRGIESPHTLLAQACRRLSANAEENREYPLANEFHYWAMDAVRKGSWGHFKGLSLKGLLNKETWHDIREHFGLITTLYWALSGYGVRAARAFWILVSIWLTFAALYFLLVESSPFWVISASNIWQGIDYARQAAVYSLSALVRLNPRPPSEELNWFQTLVTIEGILGPLQIALLVLAIRRKVMR